MNCDLCNDETNSNVCGPCRNRMRNGEHPIICLTCRDRLGKAYSVLWIDRGFLDDETAAVVTEQAHQTGNITVFMREKCEACTKTEMPKCTSSVEASA